MKDTISRAEAIDAVIKRDANCGIDSAEVLRSLPSAQPERKTGQWQEDPSGYGFWICSACGFVSEASGADLLYNFCPNCGADMRGGDSE